MTRGWPGLTASQRREIWQRWRAGESMSAIARALDRNLNLVRYEAARTGGYPPRERIRRAGSLSLAEREEISRGVAQGVSARAIAAGLGRSPSTVCREINRHGGRADYRAAAAEITALDNARRPQQCLLARNVTLRQAVAAKLSRNWSPEQISGWLVLAFPDDEAMQVSTETIYKSLFVQTRGVLRKELTAHLRSPRATRRAKCATRKGQGRGYHIVDGVPISRRPAEAADRAVPGHWEGDMVEGRKNTYVLTLVERQSRYLMLIKVSAKDTAIVVPALIEHVQTLPAALRRSLTWDRGTEMAAHKKFTIATDVAVYFCDPASPWQRGSNENTNRLLRQYLPKGSNVSVHTQTDLDAIAEELNTRPRKTLGFHTPADIFNRAVALTD
jgi:IS30 family transposase